MMRRVFVIWSIEHSAWWAPARHGYTPELAKAGVYTEQESAKIVAQANIAKCHECRIPIESVRRNRWQEEEPEDG